MRLACAKLPSNKEALTNKVYCSERDFRSLFPAPKQPPYVEVRGWAFTLEAHRKIADGQLGLNRQQRTALQAGLGDELRVDKMGAVGDEFLADIQVEVDHTSPSGNRELQLEHSTLVDYWRTTFGKQFFAVDQELWIVVGRTRLRCCVKRVSVGSLSALLAGGDAGAEEKHRGVLTKQSNLVFFAPRKSMVKIAGAPAGAGLSSGVGGGAQMSILSPNWNFGDMGIGGLDNEFSGIFRRAFASRIFPASEIAKYGIKHVRGILLYGPPGTGKTLMARQIGQMLNAVEPKIISGPEVLNKFVGQSEENVRNLFVEAEQEYAERGDDSNLHIIIFDEIDAICKQRGASGSSSGVGDTVVNQLLAKLDGVDQLNNILVIGMTNRKELIDDALLRPGRLEVHMEIGLPDQAGRLQILTIHTKTARENGKLDEAVDLELLAKKTKNFSGAELEGLVKSATGWALNEVIQADSIAESAKKVTPPINMEHFRRALTDVIPAFGLDESEFDALRGNIINHGPEFKSLMHTLRTFTSQVQSSEHTPLMSVLLGGPTGCGKTTIALETALASEFPFAKLISPAHLVGFSEAARCAKISKVFDDAHKSPLSVVVLDDLERLIDYVSIGPRLSTALLNILMVYVKKPPPKGRKLLILATTSKLGAVADLDACFTHTLRLPLVSTADHAVKVLESMEDFEKEDLDAVHQGWYDALPIKRMLMLAEMAKQEMATKKRKAKPGELGAKFLQCMELYK